MTRGPEDDAGLAGKVAIISGGGAVADGIGNGRAAAVPPSAAIIAAVRSARAS